MKNQCDSVKGNMVSMLLFIINRDPSKRVKKIFTFYYFYKSKVVEKQKGYSYPAKKFGFGDTNSMV